jgi:hypothetical protein
MFFVNASDLLYFVGSICLILVTVFLCWALYEVAHLLKQADEVVTKTRTTVEKVEDTIASFVERLGSLAGYAGILTAGGKKVMRMMERRKKGKKNEE